MASTPAHDPKAALARIVAKWPQDARHRPLFVIRDWRQHFENATSERIVRPAFVLLPNKHDGKGFRRLSRRPDGAQVFASWVLICQLASKAPARGHLADEDGPYTPLDMSDMTGFPCSMFEQAIAILASSEIGWIDMQTLAIHPGESRPIADATGDAPRIAAISPVSQALTQSPRIAAIPGDAPRIADRMEWNGMEQKGMEGTPYRPQGDQTQPDEIGTDAAAQKKEGGAAPGSMEAINRTVARICAFFPGRKSGVLGAKGMHGLRTIADALPLPESSWSILESIFAARKKEGAGADDFTLRHGWLTNAECLAENLLAAVDIARDWLGKPSAPARTATGAPGDWREKMAARWPDCMAQDWDDLTREQQEALRA